MTNRKQSDAGNQHGYAWADDEVVDHAIATATQYGRQAALASEVAQARYLLLARIKELRLDADRLHAAIVEFAKWDKGSHGFKWSKALKQLHAIADAAKVKP
jgi:hypothetical protein